LPGKHVAVQVLWDGDSDGWFVDVEVVTAGPEQEGEFVAQRLGSLRYGGDIRLFRGEVPPWPEAVVAQRAGKEVADALGLDFYFPELASPSRQRRQARLDGGVQRGYCPATQT
jgi:hypothetical protein